MPAVSVQELIEAGVHFGHQASRWNPKMKPFIHGRRHKIHLIDLKQTIRGLLQASHFLRHLASTGHQVLFVGTKRQIRSVVDAESRRCGMPAITERWIGGTLTNFNTVRDRLGRLEELEAMEADGTMERHKKKAQAMLRREMRKIQRNLEGVRQLHGMPGAIVVIDPRREDIAMLEAKRMNVPVIAILDTDCDPDLADIVIPGNDDAHASVQLLLGRLVDAIAEGRASVDEQTLMQAQRSAQDDPRARVVMGRRQQGERPPRRGGGGGGGGGRREQPQGGRLGRRATGRFADRASGPAGSVSVGGDAAQEAAGSRGGDGAASAPSSSAPAADAPPVESAPSAPANEAPPSGAATPPPPAEGGDAEKKD